ncbi:hypothetical protein B0H13DRAFT_1923061 [Mycena leptocephala]|nr:hypothetical protein B0H13DRAFT_1923061 [Mycena leptocephala]
MCQDVHWKYNMEQHLGDRHPKWELIKSREDREAFSSTFSISDLERRNLGIVEVSPVSPGLAGQSERSDPSVGDTRGQKRPPVSPAGTPRRISRPAADGSRVVTNSSSSSFGAPSRRVMPNRREMIGDYKSVAGVATSEDLPITVFGIQELEKLTLVAELWLPQKR